MAAKKHQGLCLAVSTTYLTPSIGRSITQLISTAAAYIHSVRNANVSCHFPFTCHAMPCIPVVRKPRGATIGELSATTLCTINLLCPLEAPSQRHLVKICRPNLPAGELLRYLSYSNLPSVAPNPGTLGDRAMPLPTKPHYHSAEEGLHASDVER